MSRKNNQLNPNEEFILDEEISIKIINIAIKDDAKALQKLMRSHNIKNGIFWMKNVQYPRVLKNYPIIVLVFAYFGSVNCLSLIQRSKGFNLATVDKDGKSLFHFLLCSKEREEIFNYIKEFDTSYFTKLDDNNNSPLHFAAMYGRKEYINYYLNIINDKNEMNGILNMKNQNNETIIDIALKYAQNDLVFFLYSKQEDMLNNEDIEGLFEKSIHYSNTEMIKFFGGKLFAINDPKQNVDSIREYTKSIIRTESYEAFMFVQQYIDDFDESILIQAIKSNSIIITKHILAKLQNIRPVVISNTYNDAAIQLFSVLLKYCQPSKLGNIIDLKSNSTFNFYYDKMKLLLQFGWHFDDDFLYECSCHDSFVQVFPLLFKFKIIFNIQSLFSNIIKSCSRMVISYNYIDLFVLHGAVFNDTVLHELSDFINSSYDIIPVLEYLDSGNWIKFGRNQELDHVALSECSFSAPFLSFLFQFDPDIPFLMDFPNSLTYKILYETTEESFAIYLNHDCIDMQFDSEENSYVVALIEQNKIYAAEQLMRKYNCFMSKELIERKGLFEAAIEEDNFFLCEKFASFYPKRINKELILRKVLYAYDDMWDICKPLLQGMDCRDIAVIESLSTRFSNKTLERLAEIGFQKEQMNDNGNQFQLTLSQKHYSLYRSKTYIALSQRQSHQSSPTIPKIMKIRRSIIDENINFNI